MKGASVDCTVERRLLEKKVTRVSLVRLVTFVHIRLNVPLQILPGFLDLKSSIALVFSISVDNYSDT